MREAKTVWHEAMVFVARGFRRFSWDGLDLICRAVGGCRSRGSEEGGQRRRGRETSWVGGCTCTRAVRRSCIGEGVEKKRSSKRFRLCSERAGNIASSSSDDEGIVC
jgi:hypothetical protein